MNMRNEYLWNSTSTEAPKSTLAWNASVSTLIITPNDRLLKID
jgi:hypothetical protein